MDYVTGLNGFLGSYLNRSLKAEKRSVSSIPHDLISTVKLKPFDRFYFLSTYGNIWNHGEVDKVVQANLTDLIYIIKQAVVLGFKSFVYISTSSVKLEMQTAYSRMKRAAEELLLMYMEATKLPILIIRPFSITGPGEQKEHLIPTLIHAAHTGETISFSPRATHDFIHVQDVVDCILNLSSRNLRGVFEIGWGKRYTNEKVLEIVEKETKKKVNVNVVDSMRPYDNYQWFSTNFKVRSWGWLPKITLEETIKQMVEAYDK